MNNEVYWGALLEILINLGRQTGKDKIELYKNSINPYISENLFPFSFWTYHESFSQLHKTSVNYISNQGFSDCYVSYGYEIIIEKYKEGKELALIFKNIWSLSGICENEFGVKTGPSWVYNNYGNITEILEEILIGSMFITEKEANEIFDLQKIFNAKKEQESIDLFNQIENFKKQIQDENESNL